MTVWVLSRRRAGVRSRIQPTNNLMCISPIENNAFESPTHRNNWCLQGEPGRALVTQERVAARILDNNELIGRRGLCPFDGASP